MNTKQPTFRWQFGMKSLLLLITLVAALVLPVRYFFNNLWRFRHHSSPDITRQRSMEWLRTHSSPAGNNTTMHSQESDLPSP